MASDSSDDEKAGNSGQEYVAATECNFKHQALQSKDHFEKLLEETCQNNLYPVKHKLKDCTMMKKIHDIGVLSKGRKPMGDLGGKDATPIPGEAMVMTIFD
jgi:hypothetical protein